MKDAHPNREEAREEFVTSRQLAEVLQVSESTVRRLARDGRIPCVRLTPRLLRFNLKAVIRALDGDGGSAQGRRARRQAEEDSREEAQLSFADML
ncbi:MAG TPA: helix-turn-helix domain-containing protein [Pyrinomonadaceae bacterium]